MMTKAWLNHYDPGVPASIGTYPDKTLVDFVAQYARETPDATVIHFKGRKISFRELDEWSSTFARGLKREGVSPGDRVALILPNTPQFMIAELAIWKLGAILTPQSLLYTERELQESFATTNPSLAIVLTPYYEKVKNIQRKTSVRKVIATNVKEYLPPLLGILFTLFKEKKEGHRIRLQPGDLWFQDVLRNAPLVPLIPPKPEDPAVILMSGGTTGTPKGVLSDHRSLVMSGMQLGAWLRDAMKEPDASVMLPLPLFPTYGCAGAQSLTLTQGRPLVLVPNPRDIDDVVKTIQRDQPALFCGVPTLFSALLNHPAVVSGKADFGSIQACFSGAAPLMAETKKRFEDLTGGTIVEGYSLTEATMATFANPLRGTNKIGSVGMPVPDVEVRIVDSDEGTRELGTGEVGEITIKAPQLMRGYWENPEETAAMLRDGWLYTADLGYLDEDGYLFIVDRKKDLIKTSGYQVWPREVEEVIASHPSVAEVGVAGLPDAAKGEAITAWVVPRPGETIDKDALRLFCKDKLAPYKVPSNIEIRAELPKTMVGKVLRRVLVAEAKEKAS
jgi:long-chain acyl-CoA synthetase